MIVVTKDGFVHLSSNYEIRCDYFEHMPGWQVLARWDAYAGAILHVTENEEEARFVVKKLSETAWGDDIDGEQRVEIKDILGSFEPET